MSISKPKTINNLYKFFVAGLPREPVIISWYASIFRRRGWNILTDSDRDNWLLSMSYFSNWKQDNPKWSLNILKYT